MCIPWRSANSVKKKPHTWIRLSCFILIPLFFYFALYNTVDFGNGAHHNIMTIAVSFIVGLAPIVCYGFKNDITKFPLRYNPFGFKKVRYQDTYLYYRKGELRTFGGTGYIHVHNNSSNINSRYAYSNDIDKLIYLTIVGYDTRFDVITKSEKIHFR